MPATPTWRGTTALFEAADSGQWSLGDVNSYTQTRFGPYADCVAARAYKGTAGTGSLTGLAVKSCVVTKQRGLIGKMVTVWEESSFGGGSVLPADEVALSPQELNPPIEKNHVFTDAVSDLTPYVLLGGAAYASSSGYPLIDWVRKAGIVIDDTVSKEAWDTLIQFATPAGHHEKFDQALVLADFLRKAVQNYYQASFDYTYTQHFSSLPAVSAGGFVETPGGTLGSTIASLGLSCLRLADSLDYSNGIYKRTRRWLCGPSGHWDAVLYP